VDRRKFVFRTLVSAALGTIAGPAFAERNDKDSKETEPGDTSSLPRVTDPGEMRGQMLYRQLGSTGERVSVIGLGGSHIAKPAVTETESIRLIHEAIDRGITFMDNSWDYNQGQSEMRMGKALAEDGYRDKVFLMTKIDGRTKDTAMRQIETSLERLKTDHVDLLQHHEVRTASLVKMAQWKRLSKRRRQGNCALSALPDIKIRAFIFICWNRGQTRLQV
jgi:hypothetical protein